jgi:hypothetical protein
MIATRTTELRFPVTSSAAPGGESGLWISASLTLPTGGGGESPIVLVCWPGGGYSRAYWDMQLPGRTDYSFATTMADRGFVVIAADELGVGESAKPANGDLCGFVAMAEAAADVVAQIRLRVADGTLSDELPAIANAAVVGVGHSMGGALVCIEQALFASYDGIAPLGFTHGGKGRAVGEIGPVADDPAARLEAATAQARAFFGPDWDARYGVVERTPHLGWLHGPDFPAEVLAADLTMVAPWPAMAFIDALLEGFTADFAARVASSVFVSFGENDVPERPHDDVGFYTGSNDVTLLVVPGAYHCHNFQEHRAILWDGIATWARSRFER